MHEISKSLGLIFILTKISRFLKEISRFLFKISSKIWLLNLQISVFHVFCTLNLTNHHNNHIDYVQLDPPFQFDSNHSYATRWPHIIVTFSSIPHHLDKGFLDYKQLLDRTTYLIHCLIFHPLTCTSFVWTFIQFVIILCPQGQQPSKSPTRYINLKDFWDFSGFLEILEIFIDFSKFWDF